MPGQANQTATPAAQRLVEIDAVCDQFEAAWLRGDCPELREYLDMAAEVSRPALFRELFLLEREYQAARGHEVDLETYRERFPEWAGTIEALWPAAGLAEFDTAINTLHRKPEDEYAELATSDLNWSFASAGYEILGELGKGGMGVVYRARQAALSREVALKVIRSRDLATEAERVRFQNEAEAVASLDHPHVVPIFEIGRVQGLPFFSMKLITGSGLDRRLVDFAANPTRSAQVAAKIARAIHHAHQRGVLHRDLKPANILIDDHGEPHVTDFGLARKIDADSDLSQPGAIVGTPSYLSPEQVSCGKEPLTTATDVHGLGTILYAMLVGKAPFAGTTLVDILDMVRDAVPELPSLKNPRVDRDLETICLKCLEKEPGRRYSSALALAEDLERYLAGLPIEARPVGRMTRFVKWCRRNKAVAALAALVVASVVGGFAGVAWKWREAVAEGRKAESVVELLNQRLLSAASPENDPLGKNPTVRELLDRASAQLGGWVEGHREVEAALRETLGGAYLALGQYDRAADHLERARRLAHELGDGRAGTRVTNLLGQLLIQSDQADQAVTLLRTNLTAARDLLVADDPITLEAAERLGQALLAKGELAPAEALLKQNVADRRRLLAIDHPDTLRSIYRYSLVLRALGRLDEAQELAFAYAHGVQCSRGANHPDILLALKNQAEVFRAQGNHAQADLHEQRAQAEARRLGLSREASPGVQPRSARE